MRNFGYREPSQLSKAPDFNRSKQQSPDIMHTVGDVCSSMISLINGKSDTIKVRRAEETQGRFPQSWVPESTDQIAPQQSLPPKKRRKTAPTLPPAPWSLSKEEI